MTTHPKLQKLIKRTLLTEKEKRTVSIPSAQERIKFMRLHEHRRTREEFITSNTVKQQTLKINRREGA